MSPFVESWEVTMGVLTAVVTFVGFAQVGIWVYTLYEYIVLHFVDWMIYLFTTKEKNDGNTH